jgi:hypothetical protein
VRLVDIDGTTLTSDGRDALPNSLLFKNADRSDDKRADFNTQFKIHDEQLRSISDQDILASL